MTPSRWMLRSVLPASILLAAPLSSAIVYASPAKLAAKVVTKSPAAPGVRTVFVATPRLRLGELVSFAEGAVADFDVGPSPVPSGSRVFGKAELASLLRDAGFEGKAESLAAVRVVRKTRAVDAALIEGEIQKASLPRGVTLAAVRAPATATVPDGFDRSTVEFGKVPRRAGAHRLTAIVTFARGTERLASLLVPVELNVSDEGAKPDAGRGQPVQIVLRRGLIEVAAAAVLGADANVGETVPVTIRNTGRVVRAKLTEPGKALFVEGP
ncbi:MAG: flagella basal body P-ring formation protein FlgA [Myxococcales bacterium]|nr:flagella basal body P-ring formation protein FlgA [Myxococcales bacterium]